MPELQARRRLVKSPPELWAEVSDAASLARHLGELGEITITRLEPETTVAWEGEHARGTVELAAAGWGTAVTLTAEPIAPPEPTASPESAASAEPDVVEPPEPEPVAVAEPDSELEPEPEPASEPEADAAPEPEAEAASAPEADAASEPEAVALPQPDAPRRLRALLQRLRRRPVVAAPAPSVAQPEPELEPAPEPAPVEEPAAAAEPPAPPELEEPPTTAGEPAAAAEPPEPEEPPTPAEDPLLATLTGALDSLGAAHHRPFSRG